MRAQQREHQGAVGLEIAWQADIEQRHPASTVAVVHPVLRRKLNAWRSLQRAEWDLLQVASILDRCREQRLVTHIFLSVNQFRPEFHPLYPGVQPHPRAEGAVGE